MSKLNYFEVKLNIVIIHSSLHCHQCIFQDLTGNIFFILLDRRCFAVIKLCKKQECARLMQIAWHRPKNLNRTLVQAGIAFHLRWYWLPIFQSGNFFCPEGTATWKKVRFCFIQDKVYSECYVCSLTSLGNLLKKDWFNRNRRTFPSLLKYPWYSGKWGRGSNLSRFSNFSQTFHNLDRKQFEGLSVKKKAKACFWADI